MLDIGCWKHLKFGSLLGFLDFGIFEVLVFLFFFWEMLVVEFRFEVLKRI